jgi:hypothetical protein
MILNADESSEVRRFTPGCMFPDFTRFEVVMILHDQVGETPGRLPRVVVILELRVSDLP